MHPKLVKHVIFRLHEKIFGRGTYRYLAELERLQWASAEKLRDLKFEKLKALLLHAERNIPFYGQRFAEAGFKPGKMQALEDLRVLPLLTKADIRENLDRMQWRACPGGLHPYNTGGSSGEPLIFYFDRRRQGWDAAARALTHRWWDVDIGDRELYLWGHPVEKSRQDRFKEFRDRITNQLLVSAFDVSEAVVPEYVKIIRDFQPKCIFGYPSTLALFCRLAREQGHRLETLGVQVVFCTAEVLYDHQRTLIGEAFGGIPVVDSYGCREGGNVNGQCREWTYHVMDPNFVIEYVRDGASVPDGEEGEIVLTHLDAWGMPFIRYNTKDVARPGRTHCPCGRGFSTMAGIQGRSTDFVLTPDGRWQHGLGVIYVIREIPGVEEFKIVQEAVDRVRVLLKPHATRYPEDGDRRIVEGLKKRLGAEVDVTVEKVDRVPREASGKYRYVVSKVTGDASRAMT